MPDIGDVLGGKYELIRLIGEGGMGSVYEAVHGQIGKRVAVKVLNPKHSSDSNVAARFAQEANAAGAIGHRGIIDIHDMGTADDDSLYLVMELLEGRSLGQMVEAGGGIAPELAAYVVAQVLSALDAAHIKGIIHRDLKPDNIFLVESGQVLPDVKLLDFGISKITQGDDLGLTRTGTVMGTPYYMAPEQARGAKDLGFEVDLYAMGVILYECLTGRVPFLGENALALANEILNGNVVMPRQLRPEVPEGMELVTMKAMARDPSVRYESAASMFEALLPFLDGAASARVTPPKSLVESNGPGRDYSTGQIQLMAATPPAGLSTGAETPMAWTASGSQLDQPKSRRPLLFAGIAVVALFLLGSVGAVAAIAWPDGDSATVQAAAPPPPPPPVTEAPAETPAPEPVAAESPQPEPAAPLITIRLNGVPEGARILVDGERAESHELQRPQSDDQHQLRIEHDGHEPWERTVRFDRPRALIVQLARAERQSASEREQPAPSQPATQVSSPRTTRPATSSTRRSPRRTGRRVGSTRFDTSFH